MFVNTYQLILFNDGTHKMNEQNITYQVIAESLLGRALTPQDGIDQSLLVEAEQKLGLALPEALKDFYLCVGQIPQFMGAFQIFALPLQLHVKEDQLIFLEDDEGGCYWGVDKQDQVFQFDEEGKGYNLGFNLTSFLSLMLYYQVAQGAEYAYSSNLLDQELAELYQVEGWQKVIDYDDLVIYQLNQALIWYFKDEEGEVLDDIVYFVSLLEVPKQMIEQYVLEELE